VAPDWWGLPKESGWPYVGECRNCGERGHAYDPPPLAPEVRDNAAAFARWLREAISDHAGPVRRSESVGEEMRAVQRDRP
jgi:hypothetical protein